MNSFIPFVISEIVMLLGHFAFMKSSICLSTKFDSVVILFSSFPKSCHFVNDTPVLLIASHMSTHIRISFHASEIVVGINLALGSFFNSLAIFEVPLTAQFTAINSQTSLAVGILPSEAI